MGDWFPLFYLLQKLKRLLDILCSRMRYKLPDWCLQNIYFVFVHPYILYGLEVYGNAFPSYLDKLTELNNKLLRILQKKAVLVTKVCICSIILCLLYSCLITRFWILYTKLYFLLNTAICIPELLERCNPLPHVANRHISISHLLSLWRHSHYDVSRLWRSQPTFSWRHCHCDVISYWADHAHRYGRTYVWTPYRV